MRSFRAWRVAVEGAGGRAVDEQVVECEKQRAKLEVAAVRAMRAARAVLHCTQGLLRMGTAMRRSRVRGTESDL